MSRDITVTIEIKDLDYTDEQREAIEAAVSDAFDIGFQTALGNEALGVKVENQLH